MPTTPTYVVAPDSEYYVIVANIKSKVFYEKDERSAQLLAHELRKAGYDVIVYRECDMVVRPTLLIPLEAESIKIKTS